MLSTASTTAGAQTAAAATPRCTTAGLEVWLGVGGGGGQAGSIAYPMELTNVSGHACQLFGFPGVSAEVAGHQVGSAARRNHAAPERTVTWRAGATAHTVLQIADVSAFAASTCKPVTADGLPCLRARRRQGVPDPVPLPGLLGEGAEVPLGAGRCSRGSGFRGTRKARRRAVELRNRLPDTQPTRYPHHVAICTRCGQENPGGARFCNACAAPLGGMERGEERKLATMLFADLAGSTELGSRLDPERLRSLLQRYFAAVAACIDSWGGTVEKYIGDAVLAVFGVPVAREHDAERAVRAALEILQQLEELNPSFERHYGVTLRVRIGLNTGEVIAPASDDPSQTLVAGDAVNVAARLEQAARPGTVLVGRRTYAATRRAFRFEGPIALRLKGKGGTVDGYRVLGREAGMEGMRAPVGLTTGMVGRGREIDALMTRLGEAAAAKQVRTVFVRGPAGIGKSRLVQELVDRTVRLESTPTVYGGRCLAAGRGITYWALGEILRSAFGIALDDPPEVAGDKLRDGVREALTHLATTDDEVQLMMCALAATASLSLPESPLERMEPQEVGEHIARAWPRLVTALAARGPLVLVFEDIHWADDRLMAMLHTLAVRAHGPVLLVATARPDGPDVLALSDRIPGAATIRLDSLSEAESGELITGLLSGAELSSGLRGQILGRAEGNPLFLEELVGRLIDEGALVREADRWVAVPGARLAVLPDTVHAVLSARLDWLPRGREAGDPGGVSGGAVILGGARRASAAAGRREGLPGRARAEGVSQGAAGLELRRAGRVPVQARADPGRGVREPLQSPSRARARGCGGMDDGRRGRPRRGGGGAHCPSLFGCGHRRRRPGVDRRARSAACDRRGGVRCAPLRRDGRSAQVRRAASGGAA